MPEVSFLRGLPKKYIKKYGISKRAWAAYRRGKGSRKKTSNPKKVRRVARRRYRRKARRAYKAASPLIGFGTFAIGAHLGEMATDTYIRPWMQKNESLSQSMLGQGAVLLGLSYATKRFTNRRGIKNAGLGASAYMAAKGIGLLRQGLGLKWGNNQ